ncbi:FtsK/SpoIIIE domain-containing protein [uncultured Cohaesibacter sp.]|uniref:FtsK/SpoIIIE domain-containing protein n=1 Tax=uncultured Cohaesibacter sp. TaxID=1002546 RepID=UPI0029C7D0D5|nr:FtsK/SpoIIIE domain-containing protein [uncultured Cohaesibacter sp.]
MTRTELIASVAAAVISEQLNAEPDGTHRICMLGLDGDVVCSIANATISDAFLAESVLVRIGSVFDPDRTLSNELLSDESITHWRHCKLPDGKRAVLFAATQAELQRNDKSVEKVTRIETDKLRLRYDDWMDAVGITEQYLDANKRVHLKAALRAANETHAARSIGAFADFVLEIADAIKVQGLPLQKAIDASLSAIRLPRYAGYFDRIPEKKRASSSEWAKIFKRLHQNIRPLLVRENDRGEPIDGQLKENYAAIEERLTELDRYAIEAFLDADLSADTWTDAQSHIVDLDWRTISEVFIGPRRAEKLPLGERTVKFFDDEFDDTLEDEERTLLSREIPKSPSDDLTDFFNNYQEHIARDKALYAAWEKYIYNNPQPYSNFFVGLIETLHRLRDCTHDKDITARKLVVSIPRSREKSFWRGKNARIMRYFAFRHRGISKLFGPNVIFKFGKLDEFYFPDVDQELSRVTSTARDARSLKFEVEFDPEGAKAKLLFVWEMPASAVATSMASDLIRIANFQGERALLPTADIARQSTSSKGRIQRIDLSDQNTIRDVANGSDGTMVAPNRDSGDRGDAFLSVLEELKPLISQNGSETIRVAFQEFMEQFSSAIRDWVGVSGDGVASATFISQAEAYGHVLDALIGSANNDRARERLWTELLRIGTGNVGGGTAAAVILPWHPLRLAEVHIKAKLVADLVNKAITSDEDDIFRADLLFHEKAIEQQAAFYPEVCVGFEDGRPLLLSVTDTSYDYSLAEQPQRRLNGSGEDAQDTEPSVAAKAFSAVGEQFLSLLPHERTNFSVVLYNAESKALPSALAVELSSKVEQENELQCDLLLTHSQPSRMRRIYEQQNVAVSDDTGSVMASEAARHFLSRLRVGFLDESRISGDEATRAADLVALQDVIARNANIVWKRAPGLARPSLIDYVPLKWSKRRPVGAADTATSVYLSAPVQPFVGQVYLNALHIFLHGDNAQIGDVIPAREVNFADGDISEVFKNSHRIGEWVVNYDELVDRRLLANNGVQVIRHIHDRNVDRNITVSTTSKPRLLHTLLKERLNRIDPSIVQQHGEAAVQKLTDQANYLSGHVVMRAARYGRYANELIGVVLSMEELKSGLGDRRLPIGWYFLDDFASWFGQKEEQIADIMAIAPRFVDGKPVLMIAFSEAKFVTSRGYRSHAKKSAKQLEETVLRLGRALDPSRARIDRDAWLHRIGDFMIEGMQPFDPELLGGWDLHRWSEEVREDIVPIVLVGFSHVFVHDEDEYVDAGGETPLKGTPHCVQQVYDKPRVASLLRAFVSDETSEASSLSAEQERHWRDALVSQPNKPSSKNEGIDYGDTQKSGANSNSSLRSIEDDLVAIEPASEKIDEVAKGSNLTVEDIKNEAGSSAGQFENYPNILTKLPEMPSQQLAEWLGSGSGDCDDTAAQKWLDNTVIRLQRALRGYDMTAELIGSRLTPNAALVRLRGSDDLTLPKVEKRRQELLTSHAIDVINVLAAPMEIVIMVRRPNRAILRLKDLWRKRELPSTAPVSNTSLLLGAKEADGDLLYLNVGDGFGGLQPHGPHTLIAGETGSGKGVLVQCLLLDICATNDPQSARIKMIDPKAGIDFPWLRNMPHLDGGLITTREEAIEALEELVEEMERRNRLLAEAGVTKLSNYNRKVPKSERLPRIWMFHDELADWMLIDEYRDAVELNASRLGVKARAAGINLVLITQRPDKDALPMQLRANLTNRLVLKVADKRNSVLVLDEPGAERLLGRGHLAAKLSGEGEIILAQVPYADEDEIAELAALIQDAWTSPTN